MYDLSMNAFIEVFRNGAWQRAAHINAMGDDQCRLDYETSYLFQDNPAPIAFNMPLEFVPDVMATRDGGAPESYDRSPPSFLYDLVPQGKGRSLLIKHLALSDHERLVLPLLMAGAFNPIGHLRISSAVDYYQAHLRETGGATSVRGFAIEDIRNKSEEFLEHLSLHAMLASGTTGVQGVAPKFLLARDKDGQWFADLSLADDQAVEHWLVKLPRGRSEQDRTVLRNEAAYLRVFAQCGLRHGAAPMLVDEALFVRRFDRKVVGGQLQRLQQESLASVAGLKGFGMPARHGELVAAMRKHVTNPLDETVEYIKRDLLNIALRNTDNHARNTALQRTETGVVQLTPVFDVAPMFMDPEMIPRTIHWHGKDGTRITTAAQIIESLGLGDAESASIATELAHFGETVGNLETICRECGVEEPVIAACQRAMANVANDLAGLTAQSTPAREPHRG